MKQVVMLLTLGALACNRAPDNAAMPASTAPNATLPTQGPVSKMSVVVAIPRDQAQLDRMILAGYTPHMDHLHPPGANECPLTKGTEAVM